MRNGNVAKLYAELVSVLSTYADFELIWVNDGSTDDSYNILREISERDTRSKIVNLSRNFGQQAAYSAGLQLSSGDAVIFMEADFRIHRAFYVNLSMHGVRASK